MSVEMRVGVTRATAIAAANAVIKQEKLGFFMSEFTISDYMLRWQKLAGNAYVTIQGRTDFGHWMWVSCGIIFREPRSSTFPIEKVFVSVRRPSDGSGTHKYDNFEVTFHTGDIRITKLDKSPYEDADTAITSERRDPDLETDEDRRMALKT